MAATTMSLMFLLSRKRDKKERKKRTPRQDPDKAPMVGGDKGESRVVGSACPFRLRLLDGPKLNARQSADTPLFSTTRLGTSTAIVLGTSLTSDLTYESGRTGLG